jgi:hypothetical protein
MEYGRSGGWRSALVAVLFLVGCSSHHTAHRAELQWLLDRVELEDLLNRYVNAVDELDRAMLAEVFTPDAVLEGTFADPEAEGVLRQGFDAIFETYDAYLTGRKEREEYGVPWHFVTSPRIEIEANRAKVTAYMHNRPGNAGGTYEVDAVRTEDGWRIAKLHVDMIY